MFFVDNNSSFVTGSFYPSVAEAVAFHVPKTQLSESYTRMRGDCLNDHQVLQKSMVYTAIIGLVATDLRTVHNGAGIPGFLAQLMVGNMYRICCFNVCGVVAFCFAANGITERR